MPMGAGVIPALVELLIAAPTDGQVFNYFRSLAARWPGEIIAERLTIEGNIPLRSGLVSGELPQPIQRLLAIDVQMFTTVEIEFRGLKVTYLRSGGSGPTLYRKSLFDE